MTSLFWVCFIVIISTYVAYPCLISLRARITPLNVMTASIRPTVSVVIAAFNEELHIRGRLGDLLSLDYPADCLEIIVVSDGSSDRTAEIVNLFQQQHVTLVRLETRCGKATALNQGVNKARGEIIVFTDARQTFAPEAILQLVANFADPAVGCVSGELILRDQLGSNIQAGMGAYWRYEKWIRMNESISGSVVGATGSIYAIRRNLYHPLPQGTLLDDVLTPLNIVMQGFRCIFENKAIAFDNLSQTAAQEWRRKVRTLAGNWQLLSLRPEILNPLRNPLAWRFFCHKLLRLVVPFALLMLLCSGGLLSGPVYAIATWGQLLFYGLALAGYVLPVTRKIRLINISYFFVVMNFAAICGFIQWLIGNCGSVWQPVYQNNK